MTETIAEFVRTVDYDDFDEQVTDEVVPPVRRIDIPEAKHP
ncbi:hypothetical protein [Haladaptatus sp. AB643]|nr:hypothetical protein [Haladaptatus sp. AB643]